MAVFCINMYFFVLTPVFSYFPVNYYYVTKGIVLKVALFPWQQSVDSKTIHCYIR